ncbi:hypothetical protein [Fusibacter ferrireducens]|uniref:Uncharacterized protein n=1 Tax=Fusibacter ferrireducens TaxID=2785058 RepID=A0ABR9ZSD5_9FIRM|nr:hypothetical protein [Fusibacter ferrireducens]MBF4693362.1 hypothetical protein [Fusibacter ferrireducens]
MTFARVVSGSSYWYSKRTEVWYNVNGRSQIFLTFAIWRKGVAASMNVGKTKAIICF